MNARKESDTILTRVAEATSLREGPAGVETVLRLIKRLGPAPLNQIAREARLPLPVASAVRRELEKAGLLDRTGGLSLSQAGHHFVEDRLGVRATVSTLCPHCGGTGLAAPDPQLVRTFAGLLDRAPGLDVTLDQAPCTPETALRRASLMHRAGALEGRRILILGDDDSVALALCLFNEAVIGAPPRHPVTVLELDPNRVRFLEEGARQAGYPIDVIAHDLRDPLPQALLGAFDVVETDPPYTLEGVRLFLERARQGLKDEPGTFGFFSYAQQSGRDQFDLTRVIAETRFAITAMHPGFNGYQGASILGSVGQMIELTGVGRADRPGRRYEGVLYTAEVRPRTRRYRCRACGAVHALGQDGVPATIEALKAAGCPACGGQVFRRLSGQFGGAPPSVP